MAQYSNDGMTSNAFFFLGIMTGAVVSRDSDYQTKQFDPETGAMRFVNVKTGTEFDVTVRQVEGPE